jgi:hypothetical protein
MIPEFKTPLKGLQILSLLLACAGGCVYSPLVAGTKCCGHHQNDHDHHSDTNESGSEEGLALKHAQRLHHDVDHDVAKKMTWIQTYARKLNLLAWVERMHRVSSYHENQKYRDVSWDILFLMALSHPIEMASAPLLITAGVANEWPAWLTTGLGAGGLIISLPGLDPLCIVLVGSYFSSKKWRGVVRFTRVASARGLRAVASSIGIHQIFAAQESQLHKLIRSPGNWVVSQKGDTTWEFKQSSMGIRFMAETDGVHMPWISEVIISKGAQAEIVGLGWRLSRALNELLEAAERDQKPYFVTSVESVPLEVPELRFRVEPGALSFSRSGRMRNALRALLSRCRSQN